MGVCSSTQVEKQENRQQLTDSQRVANELLQHQIDDASTLKLLILGTGESGKTTLNSQVVFTQLYQKKHSRTVSTIPVEKVQATLQLPQMPTSGDAKTADSTNPSLISGIPVQQWMDRQNIAQVVQTLHENVLASFNSLVRAVRKSKRNTNWTVGQQQFVDTFIEDRSTGGEQKLTPLSSQLIHSIWLTDVVQQVYASQYELGYWLLDNCQYYLTHVKRFASGNFEPTSEDVLRSRRRTIGVQEHHLKYTLHAHECKLVKETNAQVVLSDVKVTLVDVGGQRTERKKWLSCFDQVHGIVFVVNLIAYSLPMYEDELMDQMTDSLNELKKIAANKLFAQTRITLVFTKMDRLKEKLGQESVSKYPFFSKFSPVANPQSVDDVSRYIRQQFDSHLDQHQRDAQYSVCLINTLDTLDMFHDLQTRVVHAHLPRITQEIAQLTGSQNQTQTN